MQLSWTGLVTKKAGELLLYMKEELEKKPANYSQGCNGEQHQNWANNWLEVSFE